MNNGSESIAIVNSAVLTHFTRVWQTDRHRQTETELLIVFCTALYVDVRQKR